MNETHYKKFCSTCEYKHMKVIETGKWVDYCIQSTPPTRLLRMPNNQVALEAFFYFRVVIKDESDKYNKKFVLPEKCPYILEMTLDE